jgi:molybdopterin converting factor small subunit
MKVQITLSGRAYHAAEQLPRTLDLPEDSTVQSALKSLSEMLSEENPISTSCLIAVSGRHLGTMGQFSDQPLRDGDELVILAPVAGG